MKNGINISKI